LAGTETRFATFTIIFIKTGQVFDHFLLHIRNNIETLHIDRDIVTRVRRKDIKAPQIASVRVTIYIFATRENAEDHYKNNGRKQSIHLQSPNTWSKYGTTQV
jgi:hypothetical protein